MEWITVTAPSVSEAKEQLLDKLGVPDSDAEFVVEDEGESKFFGFRKTEARVKARVLPKGPEPRRERKKGRNNRGSKKRTDKNEASESKRRTPDEGKSKSDRNRKAQKSGSRGNDVATGTDPVTTETKKRQGRPRVQKEEISVDQVVENMQNFLDGLTAAFGIDEKAEIEQDDENIIGHIRGQHGVLVGPKGRTLDAIQELTKIAAFKGGSSPARLKVDVGGYRAKRSEALAAFAQKAAVTAIDDQTEVVLDPMTSADRKVVHDALVEIEGIETRSVGTDPRRRVVIAPLSSE
ncbi:MAG: Jag N-terminal domain-containing protein [Acidimicrobiia bacterium]|nr:Jag N-terminal domain-containing protein [Acidimicrobiia bacterium]